MSLLQSRRGSTPIKEEALHVEEVDKVIHPIERKATERKAKEKVNNTVVDLLTSHFSTFAKTTTDNVQIFRNLVIVVDKKASTAQEAVCL